MPLCDVLGPFTGQVGKSRTREGSGLFSGFQLVLETLGVYASVRAVQMYSHQSKPSLRKVSDSLLKIRAHFLLLANVS